MSLTGIILAGGKSSRMGQDKGLMSYKGRPMISFVIDALTPLCDSLIIVSNNAGYKRFGYPVFSDLIKDKGPLGGLYTGLTKSTTLANLVLSCDVPEIKTDFLKELYVFGRDYDLAFTQKEEKIHPLIGYYSKSICEICHKRIEKDQLRLQDLGEALNLGLFSAGNYTTNLFHNVNSPVDVE